MEGKGKPVVCKAIIKEEVANKVLKPSVASLTELNIPKYFSHSTAIGILNVCNAHGGNKISTIFIMMEAIN